MSMASESQKNDNSGSPVRNRIIKA